VLVVEDEEDLLDELVLALELASIPVVCASNGTSAVELLVQHHELCLIILDWNMPSMTGSSLMSAIKEKIEPTRPVAMIALSGGWTDDEEDKAKKLGAVACIKKPYSIVTLKRAIKIAMAKIESLSE
jgi:CheY-like chemotaxis protein